MGIKCRHCGTTVNENWREVNSISRQDSAVRRIKDTMPPETFNTNTTDNGIYISGDYFSVLSMTCPEPKCGKTLIKWSTAKGSQPEEYIYPRMPYINSEFVPESLKSDFTEACTLLDISPKASATFSRKCLEIILTERGFKAGNLASQIEDAKKETHVDKAFPKNIRENLDILQKFGNFAVHNTKYKNTNEIIDIEAQEAEYCIDLINRLISYCYEEPATDSKMRNKFFNKIKKEKEAAA